MKKSINKQFYRNYYIQQFKMIYYLIHFNHRQFIELNKQMYLTREWIKKYPVENKTILKQQEVWYRLQYNNMNYLLLNSWNMIDDMDKSCFPNIDFKYDHSFRNIYTLLDIIHKIISNKIE